MLENRMELILITFGVRNNYSFFPTLIPTGKRPSPALSRPSNTALDVSYPSRVLPSRYTYIDSNLKTNQLVPRNTSAKSPTSTRRRKPNRTDKKNYPLTSILLGVDPSKQPHQPNVTKAAPLSLPETSRTARTCQCFHIRRS